MSIPTCFLIAGGTGRQGGAVINALLIDPSMPVVPSNIHVITRNTGGTAAIHLSQRGVQLIQGDLNTPTAIFEHLKSKRIHPQDLGVFLAQAHGPTELNDAKGFIEEAILYGACYFVYSSVDRGGKALSDRDASHCKTFSDKFHIEKYLIAAAAQHQKEAETRGSRFDYTILRPTWFADNADWGFAGRLCMTAWRDNMKGKALQVVVTKDIGRWAAIALLRPDEAGMRNGALSITSDKLTFQQVDEIFKEETGESVGVTYGWLAALMVWLVKDLRTMFEFIGERDYGANLSELNKTLEPTTFRAWVKGRALYDFDSVTGLRSRSRLNFDRDVTEYLLFDRFFRS